MKLFVAFAGGLIFGAVAMGVFTLFAPYGIQSLRGQLATANGELAGIAVDLVQYVVLDYQRLYEVGQGCFGYGNLGDDLLPALARAVRVGDSRHVERALEYANAYFRLCPPDKVTTEAMQRISGGG